MGMMPSINITEPYPETKEIRGVLFPKYLDEYKLIITGPPGSGKSTILSKIRGWGEEGYIDISVKGWWKHPTLTYRPRELHFGLPLVNRKVSKAIYEIEDFGDNFAVDFERIQIPPRKRGLFSVNWANRIIFEFMVPPPNKLFEYRKIRAKKGTHHVDVSLTLERIQHEVAVYKELALFFHRRGLIVYLRDDFGSKPKYFTETVAFKNPSVFRSILNVRQKPDMRSHKW